MKYGDNCCQHGQFARSCNICELERDRDEWREATIDANKRFKDAEDKLRRLHEVNQELLEALNKAESSLSDYHAGAEWGHYDLRVLEAVRAAIEKAEEQMK